MRRAAAALLACALAWPAAAHDSWLAPAAGRAGLLAFSTGNRYPAAESAPAATSIAEAACVDAAGRKRALRPAGATAQALHLRVRASGPLACWATLASHEVTLTPELVEVYLREIRPPETVRAAWADLRERGLPWIEGYRKFARVEWGAAKASPAALRALRQPAGLPLEIVVLGDAPLRAGEAAQFQVLAHGKPVTGLAVELVSERSPLGVWARSDDEGGLQHRLPFGGAWLLRATWLEADGERWRSRFATLAFEAHQALSSRP